MQSNLSVFDLISNTQEQRSILEPALTACTFDFTQILPGLMDRTGRDRIPVTWRALNVNARVYTDHDLGHTHHGEYDPLVRTIDGRRMTLGLFWYNGRIEIEASLVDRPALAAEVLLAEGAHAVDRFFLSPDQRRKIWAVWHPGEQTPEHDAEHGWAEPFESWSGEMDQPGEAEVGYFESGLEAFMSAFTVAFSEIEPTGDESFAHRTDPAQAAKIREIVQPLPTVPGPVPVPPDSTPEPWWRRLCRWLRLC